jgi:hypothetical protein
MSQPTTPTAPESNGLPEQILNLADALGEKVRTSLKQIDEINTQSSLLSLNAKIEAARAGAAGRSFAVVATEMGELSETTKRVAIQLSSKLGGDIAELRCTLVGDGFERGGSAHRTDSGARRARLQAARRDIERLHGVL